MVRTIKFMALTTVLLIGLAGVGAHYATVHLPTTHHSAGALFVFAWVFGGLGIVASSLLIGSSLGGNQAGTTRFMKELFGNFMALFVVGGILVAIMGGFIAMYNGGNDVDVVAYWCELIGALTGMAGGFFLQILIHANGSWVGEQRVPGSNVRSMRRAG